MATLYILIEGNDDERFFRQIVVPLLRQKYPLVHPWKYASRNHKEVINFLKSLKPPSEEYAYFTDIDNFHCVTSKKRHVVNNFACARETSSILAESLIFIVVKEIESWYLAGLDITKSKQLGIPYLKHTNNITKEQFDSMIPKKFEASRIDFMQEILKVYDTKIAKTKNESFKYFLTRYT